MSIKVVSNKRDREKLKEEKRKEKQRRKELRQNSKASSFEDMIAYVDENGQLQSTPPETPRTEVDASQIEISTPKQVERPKDTPLNGYVDFFNASKGYGFIKSDDDDERYFFHISTAPENIAEGDKVTFETERGTRGLNAVRIVIINK